jgi:hypothetical protein
MTLLVVLHLVFVHMIHVRKYTIYFKRRTGIYSESSYANFGPHVAYNVCMKLKSKAIFFFYKGS